MAEGSNTDTLTTLVVKYDYKAENCQELSMHKGDKLVLVDDSKDWWKVRCPDTGREGFVPSNFVKVLKPKASFISTILKKHGGGRKKSDAGKQLPPQAGKQLPPQPSPSLNNGETASVQQQQQQQNSRTNGNTNNVETYQLRQCVPACVKFLYTAHRDDEISLSKGEKIIVVEKSSDGWWRGRKGDGSSGWFPSNYVQELTSSLSSNTQDNSPLYFTPDEAKSHSSPSHSSADVLHVLVLYPFTRSKSGELTCDKGDRLELLSSELTSDWVSVRNSHGETGLVPANYVSPVTNSVEEGSQRGTSTSSSSNPPSQSISSTSNTSISALVLAGRKHFHLSGSSLADKEWYYGNISRNQCEDLLSKYAQDGDFLVRDSESTAGHYTVSLKAPARNKHFRVKNTSGILEIGQQKFTDLEALIEHYKKHPIFKHESEKLFLVKPFTCPASQDVS